MFDAALREFEEETGMTPQGPFFDLGNILQKNKKRVYAWLSRGLAQRKTPRVQRNHFGIPQRFRKNLDLSRNRPGSDVAPAEARAKLRDEQMPFVDRLVEILNSSSKG